MRRAVLYKDESVKQLMGTVKDMLRFNSFGSKFCASCDHSYPDHEELCRFRPIWDALQTLQDELLFGDRYKKPGDNGLNVEGER